MPNPGEGHLRRVGVREHTSSATSPTEEAEHDCKGPPCRSEARRPAMVCSRLTGHSGRLRRLAGLAQRPFESNARWSRSPSGQTHRLDRSRSSVRSMRRPGGRRARRDRRCERHPRFRQTGTIRVQPRASSMLHVTLARLGARPWDGNSSAEGLVGRSRGPNKRLEVGRRLFDTKAARPCPHNRLIERLLRSVHWRNVPGRTAWTWSPRHPPRWGYRFTWPGRPLHHPPSNVNFSLGGSG